MYIIPNPFSHFGVCTLCLSVASDDTSVAPVNLSVVTTLEDKINVVALAVAFVEAMEQLLQRVNVVHDKFYEVKEDKRALWPVLEAALDNLLASRRHVLSDMQVSTAVGMSALDGLRALSAHRMLPSPHRQWMRCVIRNIRDAVLGVRRVVACVPDGLVLRLCVSCQDYTSADQPVLPAATVDDFKQDIDNMESHVAMLIRYAELVTKLSLLTDMLYGIQHGEGLGDSDIDVAELCVGVQHAIEEANAGDASVLRLLHSTQTGGQGPSEAAWEHFGFLIQVTQPPSPVLWC